MDRYAGTRPVRNIRPRKPWGTLKGLETRRNDVKQSALRELMERGLATATTFRIRGYRNDANFITMIYLIGAPITALLQKAIPQ